jgi:hypothetical protein
MPSLIEKHSFEHMKRTVERYSLKVRNSDKKYILLGSTFINGRYTDYLDENYKEDDNYIPASKEKIFKSGVML